MGFLRRQSLREAKPLQSLVLRDENNLHRRTDRGLWIEQITQAWVWRSPAVFGVPGFCSLSKVVECCKEVV